MSSRLRIQFRNFILSFHSKDLENGGWFRRLGRPVLVTYFAIYTFYYIVTRVMLVPAYQIENLIPVYNLIQLILGIILLATISRVYNRPAFYALSFIGVAVIVGIWWYIAVVFMQS